MQRYRYAVSNTAGVSPPPSAAEGGVSIADSSAQPGVKRGRWCERATAYDGFFAFESGGQLCQDKLRTKQQKEASSLC